MVKQLIRRCFNSEEIDFLKSISHLPRKEMMVLFNEKFNANRTEASMRKFCTNKGYKVGKRASMTHGFKKGVIPHNNTPFGYESVDSRGNVFIKTEKGRVPKARHVWEQHYGAIPSDSQICFKDQDRSNCHIDNLIMLKKGELMTYNRDYRQYATAENTETCMLLSKLKYSRFKKRAL